MKLRQQMQQELKRIQHEIGTTFIYVTHDQKEAITMSDVIAVVNKGKIEQMDDATTIYENPKTPFVANFIGETNLLEGKTSQVNGSAATLVVDGIEIKIDAPQGTRTGMNAHVSVCPEKISFDVDMPEHFNCYEGCVEEVIYMGNSTHYRILLSANLTIGVDVQNTTFSGPRALGEMIKIGWMPSLGVPILGGEQ